MSDRMDEFSKRLDHIMYIHNLARDPAQYMRVKDQLSPEDRAEVEEAMSERRWLKKATTPTREDLDRKFTI